MKHHAIIAAALACIGMLSTPAVAADTCGGLKLIADVQMLTTSGSFRQMVPVTINNVSKLMLLDTGGYISQITKDTAKELNMELRNSAMRIFDVSGNESHNFVIADNFMLGSLKAERQPLMISAHAMSDVDGLFSTDLMLHYDVDIDFGAGKLRYFSPDHCPGKVVYWSPQDVAAVPITIRDRSQILIPVKLDGHEFKALIDTGAVRTFISRDTAKRVFDLSQDSSDLAKGPNVNGDPKLASFTHTFHTLSFNGIDVSNPTVLIMPDRVNSANYNQQTGNRALTGFDELKLEQLTLGMDVMRHLHIYMAFKEGRFYVSAGSPPRKNDRLAFLDQALAATPNNANYLNSRCFVRGLQKVQLDGALRDCDLALKAQPQKASHIIDSKGLVLYQMGRYPEALEAYNQALAIAPQQTPSLYMRGMTKQKLGDAAGGEADISAAKAVDANVASLFENGDIGAK